MSSESQSSLTKASTPRRLLRWTIQTALHYALWLAFSGHLEPEFLMMGLVAAVGATAVSNWLFHGMPNPLFSGPRPGYGWMVRVALRFALYVPWLLFEIILANFHVAMLVLRPKLPIAPSLVAFETTFRSERALVLLAQSITLTPGTVTVDVSNGRYVVHCLSEKSRQGLEDGSIQRKVAGVFDEWAPERVTLTEILTPDEVPR